MSISLYLIETKAKAPYVCAGCKSEIPRFALHFRHDPYPFARQFRGQPTTHWCRECILAAQPGPKDRFTGRLRIPAVRVLGRPLTEKQHARLAEAERESVDLPLFRPVEIDVVSVSEILLDRVSKDPSAIHRLTPEQFEAFVCDRLFAMGFEPKQVGPTHHKDGGIDIVFWPRGSVPFPFLGAAQVKHHRDSRKSESSRTVREFAGAILSHPFNAGIVVTNTSFSPDARWFARERAKLVRLRDFSDIRRWIAGSFGDEAEWREIPRSIELCPGIVVKIRG